MESSISAQNALLREDLLELIGCQSRPFSQREPGFQVVTSATASEDRSAPVHVVVTMNEINDQHGTGPLVKRIFAGRRGIFSIRTRDDWGVHDFGDWQVQLDQQRRTRPECFRRVLRVLAGRNVQTVTCVPFLVDELLTSIAVKETFGAKLCVYIMDDQNVAAKVIPDDLMREFLEKCSLRLATHPELRDAYEQKYGMRFYILPAIVPAHLVVTVVSPAGEYPPRTAALLGSFWDQSWFDRLCSVLKQCHYKVDWYGQNRSPWVKFPAQDLEQAGITPRGIIPEDRLAGELRKYPFVIVPGGMLDAGEENTGVASLSLPGRILFAAAVSQTPILFVGSGRSCGARFIEHFGIGISVPYEARAVAAAMARLSEPASQATFRRNAAAIASTLSDSGIAGWLSASIEQGFPADERFETFFAGYNEPRGALLDRTGCSAAGK